MSKQTAEELVSLISGAAVEACWSQWASLGAPIASHHSNELKSLIDPEALLLLSLSVQHHEYRLRELTGWFAATGSRLLSVQRVNRFLKHYPPHTRDKIAEFAGLAIRAGDNRWKKYLGEWIADGAVSEWTLPGIQLTSQAATVLLLRAAFGVGLKTDLLAFLFTQQGRGSSVKGIAMATGYSGPAIRSATDDLVISGLVRESPERPVEYYLDAGAWREMLSMDGATPASSKNQGYIHLPIWCYWMQLYSFLSSVEDWASSSETQTLSPYLLSSQARDLFQDHEKVFNVNQIPVSEPAHFEGTDYLGAFKHSLEVVAQWIQDHL
ncbi:hypothetical protein ACFL6R_02940 [Gemmatimonadota bacterium]